METKFKSEQTEVLAPKDGPVQLTSETEVTEFEIHEDRESIVRRLDAAYLNLVDEMEEFQTMWDDKKIIALYQAWQAGREDGIKDWLSDQGDLFKADTWENLGSLLKEWGGNVTDRLYSHAKERHDSIAKNYSMVVNNPEGTIKNWAWWKAGMQEQTDSAVAKARQEAEAFAQRMVKPIRDTAATIEYVEKLVKYEEEIRKLPELISYGDGAAVMAFIRGPLNEIDPELSQSILNNPELPYVIALIEDHDSILTYMSYVTLMLEAVPPNFYAYSVGKGGTYVIAEIVLNLVLGFLTDGAFLAVRAPMLMARFASIGARTANVAKKIKKAETAIAAFEHYLKTCMHAMDDLRGLGRKLNSARTKPLKQTGKTKETMEVRRENLKRDNKCKCCQNTAHNSPRWGGLSVLVYR